VKLVGLEGGEKYRTGSVREGRVPSEPIGSEKGWCPYWEH